MLRKQILRFLFVGILNTIVFYTLYSIFIYLGLDYKWAVLFATLIGILFSFKTFGKFVFHNRDKHIIYKFLLVYSILYLASIGLIYVFEKIFLNYYLSGFFATLCCAVLSFILNKWYVFRKIEEEKNDE